MSTASLEQIEEEARSHKWPVIGRLFRYILRYKIRVSVGILLALIVSIANLLSISAFVPIFNNLGGDATPKLFPVGDQEERKHDAFYGIDRGDDPEKINRDDLLPHEEIVARFTHFKIVSNNAVKDLEPGQVILILCAVILPLYFFKILSLIGVIYTIGTAGLRAVRDIRMQLYRKMNRLGLDYFQKERTGMIMSRVINDVEIVGRTLSVEFTEALTNIFYILTHLAFLIYLDWQLLLITLIIVPVLLSPVSNFATRIRRAYTNQQERLADLSGHIQELISGIRVIRAFSMESFEKGRFREINERLYQNTFKGHYYHQVGPALTDLVAAVVIAGFLIWGGFRISTGGVENMGEFLAFFFVLIFIMRPIKQVSVMLNLLSAASAAAARVFYLNDQADGVVSKPDAIALTGFRDRIEFDRVCYRYEGAERDALTDISFEVRQGQTISLVGASGAGKTTLMDLLPRFDDPTSGAIRIDGVDLRDLQLANLRTSIGVVSQEVFLFNASVYENIAYGRNDVPLDRVIEIARAANADEFIQQLPGGYDAQIGERGVMLSGGQRQRLAIARALLMDPPILIFDEATSNLDNESELQVQQAIDRLLKGRTVFMIAHRLSTVFRSDVILVMDQGAIVERGTHKELLENGRIYRKLYDMQFSDGEVQSP